MSRDVSPVKDGATEVFTENNQINRSVQELENSQVNRSVQELTQNSDSDQCKVDIPTMQISLATGPTPRETHNDYLKRRFWEEKQLSALEFQKSL